MDPRYMVKQYVAVVEAPSAWGTTQRWMVFKAGAAGTTYLFSQLYPGTLSATGIQVPIEAKDLSSRIAQCSRTAAGTPYE